MRDTQNIQDYRESDLTVGHQKDHAAGVTAVAVSMKRSLDHMGAVRTAKTLLKLNQAEGFDCMSCAWPDPEVGHRHTAEFCENGAKAVAEEATTARATPEFFAAHSIAELDAKSEWWVACRMVESMEGDWRCEGDERRGEVGATGVGLVQAGL